MFLKTALNWESSFVFVFFSSGRRLASNWGLQDLSRQCFPVLLLKPILKCHHALILYNYELQYYKLFLLLTDVWIQWASFQSSFPIDLDMLIKARKIILPNCDFYPSWRRSAQLLHLFSHATSPHEIKLRHNNVLKLKRFWTLKTFLDVTWLHRLFCSLDLN